jgi:hypothetical protein
MTTDHRKYAITHEAALDGMHEELKTMLERNGWLKIEVTAGNRSLSQNALYWQWMTVIADSINKRNKTDFKPNEIHIRMKHQFLGYDLGKKIGNIEIPPQLLSTSNLTKGQMFHYMDQIDAYCAELGILLPVPADSVYNELREKDRAGG